MSEWAPRRFWQDTSIEKTEGGFTVLLDGRSVRTPSKTLLSVPTEALAAAIAEEWRAQEEKIDPRTMPFTRTANSAIDKVAPQHGAVAEMLAAYGDADLLCYRAASPQELVDRQNAVWDPMLDWADRTFEARLEPRTGIMHEAQQPDALARLSAQVHALDNHALAAFHDLVTLTGSLVLGLAGAHQTHPADEIWDMSRIDERWQAEQWGVDEEAEEAAAIKAEAFRHANRYFAMARSS
ncbi:ATP12 family chaperone protein [Cognatishimia sp. F0-27]|uniref:ATP12 family chaperone protein n=1 Tax=Cognatishimia sp. F0-27 TaxID=2816855 RepID=UPI001D0C2367|nr:ATP12 family protein [Cognatishimia sp. F0-27]MCC1494144.1 ATPase [Cognatishimia sp. F0-27]